MALVKMETVMDIVGHPIKLVEGWRSVERQQYLVEARVSPTMKSKHLDGSGIDVAFQGSNPYSDEHPWEFLGVVGEQLGLTWGGRWKSKDSTHFQLGE
jgi:peptidoglycan L-alanyl-D-glutamate endopeptidase CwlK